MSFEKIELEKSDHRAIAKGLLNLLRSFDFIFVITHLTEILGPKIIKMIKFLHKSTFNYFPRRVSYIYKKICSMANGSKIKRGFFRK